ncbi:DUF3422 domain-containing protein [uncultured Sneathiella sp.]|jgi:uncharacterized membrane-anchored protein|uniref:DUF3422 family protein n=1 Tax=uncultured Sneathiella sp. TaxID=879315 RepID=UPI0030DAD015|tara:strand:+ start:999 stop:2321 length:1323 start_codon:yes stop_codon:yes gene_type:complete
MVEDDLNMPRDCAGLKPHPLRFDINNEIHARPFEQIVAPLTATHYAMFSEEHQEEQEYRHICDLCRRYGLHPPMENANHFAADFGNFRLRWERHAEFTTYTFLRQNKDEEPFAKTACSEVPKEWLRALPGLLLTAIKAEILDKGQSRPSDAELDKYFVSESLVSSLIGSNGAQRWTDMRIDNDGYIRSLIYDRGMSPRKAGRVLLRIFEIAVYRNLSLLALPLAREVSVKIALINSELAELTEELGQTNSAAAEKDLLRDLTRVSAEIETLASKTAYRFSATRAYYQIVLSRIAELKEIPVDPYQTISEFLDRRLAPAVRTCNSVADRLADLSRRATRSANLLRTKTDFALAEQSQAQLAAMNQRAQRQLRLQETVEGLSIAAISYYLVSLVGYAAEMARPLGLAVNVELIKGASIPVILLAVWFALRRIKKRLSRDHPI